jgi:hypothetical protein
MRSAVTNPALYFGEPDRWLPPFRPLGFARFDEVFGVGQRFTGRMTWPAFHGGRRPQAGVPSNRRTY